MNKFEINKKGRKRTTSHALRSLGRIRAFEDPVVFGLNTLYKIKNNKNKVYKREEFTLINDLDQIFTQIIDVIQIEIDGDSEKLKSWIDNRSSHEDISSINTILGFYNIFTDEIERKNILENLIIMKKKLNKIINNNYSEKDFENIIYLLEKLEDEIKNKVEVEKKISEKLISSRIPTI